MTAARSRLSRLREAMRRHGVDAWLAPTGDPHLSEYVSARWRTRAWLSGFHGSAGTLVVTQDEACLWVDPRYHMRAERETAGTPIAVFKLGVENVPDLTAWLQRALEPGSTLGLDPATSSVAAVRELEGHLSPGGVTIHGVHDLIDEVWIDRPRLEPAAIVAHPVELAGEHASAKLGRLRARLGEIPATDFLITALDEVAWLLNLRGDDVPMSPVALAFCLVREASVLLFVHEELVARASRDGLPSEVEILPYDSIGAYLRAMPADATLLIDPDRTSIELHDAVRHTRLVLASSPIQGMKARKNAVELAGAASAHRKDGLALTRLLHWLSTTEPTGHTEISVADKLEELRRDLPAYRGPAFGAIVGCGPNSAVGHYASDPDAPQRLDHDAVLLIDCGGQYADGTTDTTRTIVLGRAREEQIRTYTTVLKSLIELSSATFPKGTTGQRLDALARHHLWANGWECRHGIGHGVGSFLHVHEGPQRFDQTNVIPIEPGMVTSCEPGVYFEGKFGVRLENVIVAAPAPRSAFGEYHRFETVTLCPFDRDLIDTEMLTRKECSWLNAYHLQVREALSPHLEHEENRWLEWHTRPLHPRNEPDPAAPPS